MGAVLSFSKLLLAAVNGPAVGRCHLVPAAAVNDPAVGRRHLVTAAAGVVNGPAVGRCHLVTAAAGCCQWSSRR